MAVSGDKDEYGGNDGEGIKGTEDEREWVKVKQGRKLTNGESKEKLHGESGSSLIDKGRSDFDVRGKVISFFINNIPDGMSKSAIWKLLDNFGIIVDVYLAKKKDREGSNFGFARFINVGDVKALELKLNDIWVGTLKLRINIAKYNRYQQLEGSMKFVAKATTEQKGNSSIKGTHSETSYREILKGVVKKEAINQQNLASVAKCCSLNISSSQDQLDGLQNSLIGEISNVHMLSNLKSMKKSEGWEVCNIRYIGGFNVQLVFSNKHEATKFLFDKKDIWSKWFTWLRQWDSERVYAERLIWLRIRGLPLKVWCSYAFSIIAELWGKVIIPDDCNTDNTNLLFGRVCILSDNFDKISIEISVNVDGQPTQICVEEEWDACNPSGDTTFSNFKSYSSHSDLFCKKDDDFTETLADLNNGGLIGKPKTSDGEFRDNTNPNKGAVIGDRGVDGDISSPRDRELQGGTISNPIEGDKSLTDRGPQQDPVNLGNSNFKNLNSVVGLKSHVPAIAKESIHGLGLNNYLEDMDIRLLDWGGSFFRFRRPNRKKKSKSLSHIQRNGLKRNTYQGYIKWYRRVVINEYMEDVDSDQDCSDYDSEISIDPKGI